MAKLHANSHVAHPRNPEGNPWTRHSNARIATWHAAFVIAEHVNRRLKIWRILAERYRNRRRRFGLSFNLIAALYNYELSLLRTPEKASQ